MPTFAVMLADPKTKWFSIQLADWHGGQRRKLEIVSGLVFWYHSGLPPAHIRCALVRDPFGEREPLAFLSIDLASPPEQTLSRFVSRWCIERTFQEASTHLGMETQRRRSDLAIQCTTPALLGLFSLNIVWANQPDRSQFWSVSPRAATWHDKHKTTFSDAIGAALQAS